MNTDREERRQAMRYFAHGLFQTGVGLALIPISMLPPRPQQHFSAAAHEFTRGVATLVHRIADGLDEKTKEEK